MFNAFVLVRNVGSDGERLDFGEFMISRIGLRFKDFRYIFSSGDANPDDLLRLYEIGDISFIRQAIVLPSGNTHLQFPYRAMNDSNSYSPIRFNIGTGECQSWRSFADIIRGSQAWNSDWFAAARRFFLSGGAKSVLLSLAGGAVGLFAGYAGIRAILSVSPGNIPRIGLNGANVSLDWRVLAFTLALSIGTGILFGLVPALQSSRADLNSAIKEASHRSGTGLRHNKTRALLVTVEMALAVVLLVGAALLIRTYVAIRADCPWQTSAPWNRSSRAPRPPKTSICWC
jgi:hypothetical protein